MRRSRIIRIRLRVAMIMVCLSSGFAVGDETVVFRADFEAPTRETPPPGWTMWGEPRYKDPANYTRDASQAHGGSASFRIHHPANTGGYILSSPQEAIRPEPDMEYEATFWARSERPGEAVVAWEAHRQNGPYVSAPSPGSLPLAVGPEWRRFRLTIREGWDFFADESRFLMLVFHATRKFDEEQTLWIDDVEVIQRPSQREGRLANPATLPREPLEHRLRPGEQLRVAIDANQRLRPARPEVGGVSFHRVAGWMGQPFNRRGEYVLPPELEEAIRQLRLPMTRFYALGDEPFGLDAALDKATWFLDRIGVKRDASVLEFEIQAANIKLSPETWAAGVRHSLERNQGFHRWEIANEPYWSRTETGFPTPDSYLEHFLAVSRAIRAADPKAQIGLSIHPPRIGWGNYQLKQAAGHYDFVVGHYYSFPDVNRGSFEDAVLTANHQIIDQLLQTNALMRLYNPNRDVYQYDTEWGLHSGGPNGESAATVRRNTNIWGMTHRAVRLIYYLREDLLPGSSSWEMLSTQKSPGFGFLAADAPQLRSMLYWLYYYFNRHVGRWVLAIDGESPYHEGKTPEGRAFRGPRTPLAATLSDDGRRIFVIVANGSWDKPAPARIEARGFEPESVKAVVLTNSDPDGPSFLANREDLVGDLPVKIQGRELTTTLPPHSVSFLTIQGRTVNRKADPGGR